MKPNDVINLFRWDLDHYTKNQKIINFPYYPYWPFVALLALLEVALLTPLWVARSEWRNYEQSLRSSKQLASSV